MLKITYLGQAGLLLESPSCTVMIDPYLSDSVEKNNPPVTAVYRWTKGSFL